MSIPIRGSTGASRREVMGGANGMFLASGCAILVIQVCEKLGAEKLGRGQRRGAKRVVRVCVCICASLNRCVCVFAYVCVHMYVQDDHAGGRNAILKIFI